MLTAPGAIGIAQRRNRERERNRCAEPIARATTRSLLQV